MQWASLMVAFKIDKSINKYLIELRQRSAYW